MSGVDAGASRLDPAERVPPTPHPRPAGADALHRYPALSPALVLILA